MKRFFILLFSMVLFGCSSDDNSGGNNNNTGTFLPQNHGNYWVYDVVSDEFSGRDSLYVSGTTTSQNNVYYTYSTSEIPSGFYSTLMTSGKSRVSDSKIFMSGIIGLGDIFGEEFDFEIDLNDFVVFDGNSSQGQTLDSQSGEFEVPYEDITIRIEYTLSSKIGQSHSNYSIPNGDSYQDVKSVIVAVSAKITANTVFLGFPISYPLLDEDVISSTQYYANNVGVVFVNTDFQYNLSAIPIDIELPIPQNYFSNTKEVLDNYWVD